MSEQIFAISGMHCNSCVMGVTEALTALAPVREVSVDLDLRAPRRCVSDRQRALCRRGS